jgi:NADH:ubiquinone oxidoreductase subunit 6 (subunit J)
MEMALAKYPVIVYIIATRLTGIEIVLGMIGAVMIIFTPLILMDDLRAEENEIDYTRVGMAIGAFMVLLSFILPSTNTAVNIIAHSLIDPSEYGGNFEQYQWDLEVLKNFILHNY